MLWSKELTVPSLDERGARCGGGRWMGREQLPQLPALGMCGRGTSMCWVQWLRGNERTREYSREHAAWACAPRSPSSDSAFRVLRAEFLVRDVAPAHGVEREKELVDVRVQYGVCIRHLQCNNV